MPMPRILLLLFACIQCEAGNAQQHLVTDVLVIGGGTGGTAAGIQSARLGAKTIIAEPGPWLGGMISAAGVSATDGNDLLSSGLWAEFREQIYKSYGGRAQTQTGWVSNTLFEPHAADSIFKSMVAKEKLLSVVYGYRFQSLIKKNNHIVSVRFTHTQTGKPLQITAKIYIDATELGDLMKPAGIAYDLGMEAGATTGEEKVGVQHPSDIVQDLTYVAILKDYGTEQSIREPAGYDAAEFDAACTDYYKDSLRKAPMVSAQKMLDYGRLPHHKFMINWPSFGNDTYLNIVEMNETQRNRELEKAKQTTLRFVYFIQQQLGFKNLGLADDEFPTPDRLALIPYYRESRRVKGLVRMTLGNIAEPFTYGDPLYRTGISVGDYPIDHHHKKNSAAPQHLAFYPIPSFNVPLGALIPKAIDNVVIAEKGISVSNIVNGTTRLQPCVLLTGQAAGTLAALSSEKKLQPRQVPVRYVQALLLKAKAYIMPYMDIGTGDPAFESVQKIGATGLLKGTGIPYKWANQTWFYPDSLVNAGNFLRDLNEYQKGDYKIAGTYLRVQEAYELATALADFSTVSARKTTALNADGLTGKTWAAWGLTDFDASRFITRAELAVLLDKIAHPFERSINHQGYYKPQ